MQEDIKRCSVECDMRNTALIQGIECEPLGEDLIHWICACFCNITHWACAVFSNIARKMNSVRIFAHDKVTHGIIGDYRQTEKTKVISYQLETKG